MGHVHPTATVPRGYAEHLTHSTLSWANLTTFKSPGRQSFCTKVEQSDFIADRQWGTVGAQDLWRANSWRLGKAVQGTENFLCACLTYISAEGYG